VKEEKVVEKDSKILASMEAQTIKKTFNNIKEGQKKPCT